MSHNSVDTTAFKTMPVTVWVAAAVSSLVLGVLLAEAPSAVFVALGALALGVILVSMIRQPRWALVGMLILLYSYAGWVFSSRAGVMDLSALVLLLLLVILCWKWKALGQELTIPRESVVLIALGVVWALSAIFAQDPARSVSRIGDFVGWALLVLLMISLLDSARWYRRALWAIVGAASSLAALTVLQALTRDYGNDFFGFAGVQPGGGGYMPRSEGPLQANNFAQILLVASALAWYLALSTRSFPARLAGFGAAAGCFGAMILTGSRGGLIALAAVFALVVILGPVSRRALLGGAAVALVIGLTVMPGDYIARFASTGSVLGSGVESSPDRAVRGRAAENLAALHMFQDSPILGVGIANYPVRYLEYAQEIGIDRRGVDRTPHNLYLEALAEVGVVGAAVFFLILGLALAGPWRARKVLLGSDRLMAEGAFVAVFAYLAAGMFLHAAYPRYLWIVVGLGLAASRIGDARAKSKGDAISPSPQ